MGESNDAVGKATPLALKVAFLVGGVFLIGMFVMYFALLWTHADVAITWGPLGDSVALFTSVFTAAALFAALYSVHLQRSELAAQREQLRLQLDEMRSQREEMAEQRAQLERTAAAQEELSKAQQEATQAQRAANTYALLAQRATHMATIVACDSARMRVEIGRAEKGAAWFEPLPSCAVEIEKTRKLATAAILQLDTMRAVAEYALGSNDEGKANG